MSTDYNMQARLPLGFNVGTTTLSFKPQELGDNGDNVSAMPLTYITLCHAKPSPNCTPPH